MPFGSVYLYITVRLCTICVSKSTRKAAAVKVFGVLRVSKGATNGSSLAAQRAAIEDAAAREGWDVEWVEEIVTGSGKRSRPQLESALAALDRGEAAALVGSKIDRIARSMIAFVSMMERAERNGWTIFSLDLGVDFRTPQGRLVFRQLASVAEFERELIAARTRDALRVKRAEGKTISRPTIPADVVKRIKRAHRRGSSLATIARTLNRDGIPTARGGKEWRRSTVRAVLQRA
jgi:DNA invertase Pin-like site-specific DNA recombinase